MKQIQVESTRANGMPVAIRPNLTDRALRYRANQTPPEGPRQCGYCGAQENIEIEHIDGHEENGDPENLMWACRSCNTKKGIALRNAGMGRRTRQYNPAGEGATTVDQWVAAVTSAKGESNVMSVADAVALIHDTPASRRSKFAAQIWGMRRRKYGRTGTAKGSVPF
jgi:hypothetical protein